MPSEDFARYDEWRESGFAGEMTYLTDRRGDLRSDPKHLLASAQSIVCVGKLYNTGSIENSGEEGAISRYAKGVDYHDVLHEALLALVRQIAGEHPESFEYRVCVDTAPLLERSYARQAGLGWIGRNTCLINQAQGSWFFLGELLLSIPLAADIPAPGRCGSCTRCIEACPTQAIVMNERSEWQIDARLCISYLTIEKRGLVDPALTTQTANHLFGCDICQDVCPWNRRAPTTSEPAFHPAIETHSLAAFAAFTEEDFRTVFRKSPVWRAKYSGFLRNVAWAIGNSRRPELLPAVEQLCRHSDSAVAASASAALAHLSSAVGEDQDRRACKADVYSSLF